MLTRNTTRNGTPPPLRLRPPPMYIPHRVMNPASSPSDDATVITETSRLATCASSCDSTPSSSSASSRCMMPVVTQTTEWLGVRPVAKALGMSVTATATRGLGMSASTHSRSIIACSSGACSGVTSRPPIDFSASRSEKYHCPQAIAEGDDEAEDRSCRSRR